MKRCPQCGYREPKAPPKPKLRFGGRGVRISDRDEDEKVKRGYTDPRSYVRRDGSEILRGKDWEDRKLGVWQRSLGFCEMRAVLNLEHVSHCPRKMMDVHHIIARSLRRNDEFSNLCGLSRACHDSLDQRKIGGRKTLERP